MQAPNMPARSRTAPASPTARRPGPSPRICPPGCRRPDRQPGGHLSHMPRPERV